MGVAERRERERQERRECILQAAERVFLTKGIPASTMEDIAREAELSKGALYLYFKNKDALFLSIALRAMEVMTERLTAAADAVRDRPGIEGTAAVMRAYGQYAREERNSLRVAMSWVTSEYRVMADDELFQEYQRATAALFEFARSQFERGRVDGSLRSDIDAAQVVTQVWGAVLGLVMVEESREEFVRRVPSPVVSFEGMIEKFIELFLDGLRSPA